MVRPRHREARRPPAGRSRRRRVDPGRGRHRRARERHHPHRGLVRSEQAGDDIAVGATLGGPLAVGAIAYGVTGAMLLVRHRTRTRALKTTAEDAGDEIVSRGESDFAGVDTARMATD